MENVDTRVSTFDNLVLVINEAIMTDKTVCNQQVSTTPSNRAPRVYPQDIPRVHNYPSLDRPAKRQAIEGKSE